MENGLVAVQHTHEGEDYWIFPGGGIERYETIPDAAIREMLEETCLTVEVTRLLYVREFHHNNDVEFYVVAQYITGEMALGHDPELGIQLLSDVGILSYDDLEHNQDLTFYPIVLRKRLRRDLQSPPTKALYLGHTD
jgi:ADP-ribose pyrophosphatase YjhB (NUDIX family)